VVRDSIRSNDAGFPQLSDRCLTGEIYPTPDVTRLANEQALRENAPLEFLFPFVCLPLKDCFLDRRGDGFPLLDGLYRQTPPRRWRHRSWKAIGERLPTGLIRNLSQML